MTDSQVSGEVEHLLKKGCVLTTADLADFAKDSLLAFAGGEG